MFKSGSQNPKWKGGKTIKICLTCGKKFPVVYNRRNTSNYCSRLCCQKGRIGKFVNINPISLKNLSIGAKYRFQKGHKSWLKGLHINVNKIGEESPNWKGDKVKYRALHNWVERVLGKPDICEHCHNKFPLKRKKIDWANKDHSYRRNKQDWIRLCRQCHIKYDKKNNLTHARS